MRPRPHRERSGRSGHRLTLWWWRSGARPSRRAEWPACSSTGEPLWAQRDTDSALRWTDRSHRSSRRRSADRSPPPRPSRSPPRSRTLATLRATRAFLGRAGRGGHVAEAWRRVKAVGRPGGRRGPGVPRVEAKGAAFSFPAAASPRPGPHLHDQGHDTRRRALVMGNCAVPGERPAGWGGASSAPVGCFLPLRG
ncbi:hypothetical protein E2C01_030677 [Portunus trituberculatus]|uniref:Uncharacterized protein n=1 Tax=Portunus trituberculatus TaxID=210409 RepID=A0A5B7ESL0_PORTR|nr:hypothetical protein [Portunus trituberculatus]